MTATRRGPGVGSPDLSRSTVLAGAGTTDGTSTPRQAERSALLRLSGHPDDIAADMVERVGPAHAQHIAAAVVALVDTTRRRERRQATPAEMARNLEHVRRIRAEVSELATAPPPPWPGREVAR